MLRVVFDVLVNVTHPTWAQIEEKNDKIEYILDNLNDKLTYTIARSKGKESLVISKKLKGPKGSKAPKGPEGAKGETELLKEVKFVKQRSNEDGNCFYNSVGMLSSEYLKHSKISENLFSRT